MLCGCLAPSAPFGLGLSLRPLLSLMLADSRRAAMYWQLCHRQSALGHAFFLAESDFLCIFALVLVAKEDRFYAMYVADKQSFRR